MHLSRRLLDKHIFQMSLISSSSNIHPCQDIFLNTFVCSGIPFEIEMGKLLVNFQLRDIESDQLREGQPMKPSVDGVTGNRLENYPRNSSN